MLLIVIVLGVDKWKDRFNAKDTNTVIYVYLHGCVRYGTYRGIPPVYAAGVTGTGHFGKFGTTSLPVPNTSVSSVRHQYRYHTTR